VGVGLLLLGLLALTLHWTARRLASPLLAIPGRWAMWSFAGLAGGLLLQAWFFPAHPYWALAVVGLLLAFLVEMSVQWLAIHALSRSDYPLFPRFRNCPEGDTWPSHQRFLAIKDWLKSRGFTRLQFIETDTGPLVRLRVAVYQTADAALRAHVYFLPYQAGGLLACVGFQSELADGRRLITDNLHVPFGGFYPEAWHVERTPWRRTPAVLYERHLARLDAARTQVVAQRLAADDAANRDQRTIEQLNRELGFLTTPSRGDDEAADEQGRISAPGRQRLWLELWLLNYCGRCLRY
jgi:hypothetical protein